MEWMLMPLRRYADFSGRSRRKEYWMFFLGYFIAAAIFGFLYVALGAERSATSGVGIGLTGLLALAFIALVIPSLAVQIRRFHDQDRSGWFILLSFVPYIGGLIVLVFMCLPGTVGPNRFGPDPINPDDHLGDVFS